MLKLGMHVDNWRHNDVTYEVPCEFAHAHNMEYVEFDNIVKDGDEVAFFPPVTGG